MKNVPTIVNEVVIDLLVNGIGFTAYDITKTVRNKVGCDVNVRHNEVRPLVHSFLDEEQLEQWEYVKEDKTFPNGKTAVFYRPANEEQETDTTSVDEAFWLNKLDANDGDAVDAVKLFTKQLDSMQSHIPAGYDELVYPIGGASDDNRFRFTKTMLDKINLTAVYFRLFQNKMSPDYFLLTTSSRVDNYSYLGYYHRDQRGTIRIHARDFRQEWGFVALAVRAVENEFEIKLV